MIEGQVFVMAEQIPFIELNGVRVADEGVLTSEWNCKYLCYFIDIYR